MGQLLAVHNEKLTKQDEIDQVLFEKVDRIHQDITRETNAIKKGCERERRRIGRGAGRGAPSLVASARRLFRWRVSRRPQWRARCKRE